MTPYADFLRDLLGNGAITYDQYCDLRSKYNDFKKRNIAKVYGKEEMAEDRIQVGDKVRIEGYVTQRINNRVTFDSRAGELTALESEVELVERPRPVPKLGSVWKREGYLGLWIFLAKENLHYRYWNTQHSRFEVIDMCSPVVKGLVEVKENG